MQFALQIGHASHGLNARQDSALLYKKGQVGTMWLKDRRLLTPSAFVSYFLSATDRCPQKSEMEKTFHCEML